MQASVWASCRVKEYRALYSEDMLGSKAYRPCGCVRIWDFFDDLLESLLASLLHESHDVLVESSVCEQDGSPNNFLHAAANSIFLPNADRCSRWGFFTKYFQGLFLLFCDFFWGCSICNQAMLYEVQKIIRPDAFLFVPSMRHMCQSGLWRDGACNCDCAACQDSFVTYKIHCIVRRGMCSHLDVYPGDGVTSNFLT
jgi:hypothetical protein